MNINNYRQWINGYGTALLLLFITACSKTEYHPPAQLTITGFSFSQPENKLPVNSSGAILGDSILIYLPPGTSRIGLIPRFTLADSTVTVTVNGVPQQSGITPVDFTSVVVYMLSDRFGNTARYAVNLITDISPIDKLAAAFMKKYSMPALSIAITKDDRLVYAKSYGYADVPNQVPANNNSLYRLASLSKQFTAVTIMRLIDQDLIHTEDKVFGPGSILGTDFYAGPYNPGVTDITVNELLHHTGGGWAIDNPNYPDPVFQNLDLNRSGLMSWTLQNLPLDTIPGTHYDYSNFGFFTLGRIVEKVTGLPYDSAVKKLVLGPSGITDMQIAGSTLAERLPNEVIYYPQGGENPYNIDVHREDACGGWIASATDLARFLCHVDGSSQSILSAAALGVMTTGSTANPDYGCGWVLTGPNYWHNGSLPGTSTEQAVIKSAGNFNFAILTNSRNPSKDPTSDMDNIFWSAESQIRVWPDYDLFTASAAGK